MRRLSPATQPSAVMQVQEDDDNLIPFAKCSKVVRRSPPLNLTSQSLRLTPQRYGDFFWEKLSQRPRLTVEFLTSDRWLGKSLKRNNMDALHSPTWMEEQYIPPQLRATGCSQSGQYRPEGLPPPEMLCRRKRKRTRLHQGPEGIPARVRAVTYHLEDLRRRQRIINELKKTQWSSSGSASEHLVLGEDGCGVPTTSQCPDLEEKRGTYPGEEDHFLTLGRAQLLWSPWSPLGQEGSCFFRQLSSLAPHSTATASRNPLYSPWEMALQLQE